MRFSKDTLNGELASAQCYQAVHAFKGAEPCMSSDLDSNKTAPLKAELLELAQDLPQAPSFDHTAEQARSDSSETPDDSKGKGKTLGEAKVPKWLQKAVKK